MNSQQIAEKYSIDLTREHKTGCPGCKKRGGDRGNNNLHVYAATESAHCFACGWTIPSKEHREAMGWDDEQDEEEEVVSQEMITEEEAERIKGYTGTSAKGLRGIPDEVYRSYGVRHKMSEETGEPVAQYYPITENYERSGYKVRNLPKSFTVIGKNSSDSDLFGQWRFRNASGKYLLITSGEIDAMSAYAMLDDYRKGRGSDFEPIPVVSGTVGEKSSAKQLRKHYDWLNRFERVVYCPDQDAAGQEAMHAIAKVLPKGKLFVMSLPMKDTNEMLMAGKEKQWLNAFFSAKAYTPDGIVASSDLSRKLRESAALPKIPLPPFMHKLQKMMAGGIPLKTILNAGSMSGAGKSTIVDECTYFWIFNSPYMPGIITLESDAGQYATKILSRHIGRKIDLIEDVEEKLAFLDSEEVRQKEYDLYHKPDGSPRFYLIEERDGGMDSLKELIMNLIISCGCKLIILDPLQDVLDGLSNEDQSVFLKWMKGMVKSHDVTFININHVRKNSTGKQANSTGAELYEEDMAGHSSIFKSGACNLLFTRNKEAEDPLERNTIRMKASKIRWTGVTGAAGEYVYDNETHRMWDKDEYLAAHNQGF